MWLAHFSATQITGMITGQPIQPIPVEEFTREAGTEEQGARGAGKKREAGEVQEEALAAVARYENFRKKGEDE
jgi:hypothetical protein